MDPIVSEEQAVGPFSINNEEGIVVPLVSSTFRTLLACSGFLPKSLSIITGVDQIFRSLPKLPTCGVMHEVDGNATFHQHLSYRPAVDETLQVQQLEMSMLLPFRLLEHSGQPLLHHPHLPDKHIL